MKKFAAFVARAMTSARDGAMEATPKRRSAGDGCARRARTARGTRSDLSSFAVILNAKRSSSSQTLGFQTETKRLLDIVTNSLYADKEVFLRELVSNASDALEKARHRALSEGKDPGSLEIKITTDDDASARLIVEDSGIGMTREELVGNLGTIARSGSKEFLEGMKAGEGADAAANIIGKFGVGFYASFMVSDRVEVISSAGARGDGKAWKWSSSGDGYFTIEEASASDDAPARGTRVVMHVKADEKHLVSKWGVETVLKKYSSFVGFPVLLNGVKVNDIGALWRMDEKDLTDEDSTAFYRFISGGSMDNPPFRMLFKVDAPLTIRSLLFFPEHNPERAAGFGGAAHSGVSLYSRRVLISEKTDNMLPQFLRFMRGVVDCEDIPLNISRETLQDSMLVRKLGQILTKRILKFLKDTAKKEPKKYNDWFANLGFFIKEGVCSEYDYKVELSELLRYESSATATGELTSFRDYHDRLAKDQDKIYYIVAPNRQQAEASPYLEAARSRGYEVLYLYAHIDEFVMQHLVGVAGKPLMSVEAANLEAGGDASADGKASSAEPLDEAATAELCKWFSDDALAGRLKEVKVSNRLVSSPALISGHEPEAMRRYRMVQTMASDAAASKKLAQMSGDFSMMTLELNPKHEMIRRVNVARKSSDAEIRRLATLVAEQIFDNARVAAGSLDDPRAMLGRLNEILSATLPK